MWSILFDESHIPVTEKDLVIWGCCNRKTVLVYEKVLLMAPTGVAAIQVDATTVHPALGIPVGHFGTKLPTSHDKMKCSLRNHLSDLKVIIIDEISMVSNELLFYVHLRLNEIFGSVNDDPFAGITVVVVGDLSQVPPVGGCPVYAGYKNKWQNFDLLWRHFKVNRGYASKRGCHFN